MTFLTSFDLQNDPKGSDEAVREDSRANKESMLPAHSFITGLTQPHL